MSKDSSFAFESMLAEQTSMFRSYWVRLIKYFEQIPVTEDDHLEYEVFECQKFRV